jgi:hypothetical protein
MKNKKKKFPKHNNMKKHQPKDQILLINRKKKEQTNGQLSKYVKFHKSVHILTYFSKSYQSIKNFTLTGSEKYSYKLAMRQEQRLLLSKLSNSSRKEQFLHYLMREFTIFMEASKFKWA